METMTSLRHEFTLSPHVQSVPRSATLAINERSKQLVQQGKDVIRLGLGQSPFPVPERMVSALKAYASAKDYMAVQGYLPLREAISGFIQHTEGLDCKAEDIIIGPGSKELFFGLQMALDADLVLPAPSWVSYEPQARLLGRNVHWLPCQAEDDWKLTASTLEKHCQQHEGRQQLLIINSPNNPSGACYNAQELEDLARVASRYQLIILSDEIYSELHFQGGHLSIARYYPEGTIISNGISKWAGAGGWRLGFMVFPNALRALLEAMIVIASETFTSVSAPIQMAAISAFEDSPEMLQYIHACRHIMHTTVHEFSQRLIEQGIDVVMPDGGFYCLADFSAYREALLRHGLTSAESLCQQILDSTGVAALPGRDFGMTQGYLVRLAIVDFDGSRLLQRVLASNSDKLDTRVEELQHLMSAPERLGQWLQTL